MKHLQAEFFIAQGITLVQLKMLEHQRVSQQILNSLENAVSGKITQLIPKDRLIKDLEYVESRLKENQKLPIDFYHENPLHIFKYSQIRASLYGNRLLLELIIPVIERQKYTIYKIIPIPISINNATVIIEQSTKYIAMNNDDSQYIPISETEFRDAKFNLYGEKILKPAENVHLDYSHNCETNLFKSPDLDTIQKYCNLKVIPTSNYFISLHSNNNFYVKISSPFYIIEFCPGNISTTHRLSDDGIITLGKECRMVSDKISLRPQNNYKIETGDLIFITNISADVYNIFATKLNFSLLSFTPQYKKEILIQDHIPQFNRLYREAERIINRAARNKQWDDFSFESSNTSSFLYTLIFLGILIIISLIIVISWFFYNRFFKVATWVKLAQVLENKNKKIPELFIRNISLTPLPSNNGGYETPRE